MTEEYVMCPVCEVRALVDGKCLVCDYVEGKAESKSQEKDEKKKA